MVNYKQLGIFIISAFVVLIIAMTIFPINVIDVRQLKGMPFPRAMIQTGRPLGYQLLNNITITQTFRPGADNIRGFGIFFNKILPAKPEGHLSISLNEKRNNQFVPIYKVKRKAANIELNTMNTFFFKQIPVKKTAVYSLIIKEDAATTGLSVYKSPKDPYKLGIAHLNKRPTKHDIVFQTYYQTSFFEYFKRGTKFNVFFLSLIFLIVLAGSILVSLLYDRTAA